MRSWQAAAAPPLVKPSEQKETAVTSRTGPSDENLPTRRAESASEGRYSVQLEGVKAEMTYSRKDEQTVIIEHTGVPDALRGRHIGEALVQRGVEDARAEGRKIIPLCPFAKALISRHPEWQDILAS